MDLADASSFQHENHHLVDGPFLFGEPNGSPLQHSGLGNPTDRGARQAIVHGVAESQTRLKRLSTHRCMMVTVRTRILNNQQQRTAGECLTWKDALVFSFLTAGDKGNTHTSHHI